VRVARRTVPLAAFCEPGAKTWHGWRTAAAFSASLSGLDFADRGVLRTTRGSKFFVEVEGVMW
jgi:hypothetical protein